MAAWANARDGASQAGYIAFATQRKIFKGEPAIVSIQSWKSHKLEEVCSPVRSRDAGDLDLGGHRHCRIYSHHAARD
eukprot:5520792-Pyramimonas_sp.AAC.1